MWRKPDPPPEVRASFDLDYPTMGFAPDVLAAIARSGFDRLGHFTLPDQAWWDDFHTPMQRRIDELRRTYAVDCMLAPAIEAAGGREALIVLMERGQTESTEMPDPAAVACS